MLADTLCEMIPRIFLIRILGLPEVRSWICTSESWKARTYMGANAIKRVGCWDPLKIHCSKKTSISLGVKGQEKECSWWSLDMRQGSRKRSLLGEILTVTESGHSKDCVQAMRRGSRYPDLTLGCLFLSGLAFASSSSLSSLWFILLPPSLYAS